MKINLSDYCGLNATTRGQEVAKTGRQKMTNNNNQTKQKQTEKLYLIVPKIIVDKAKDFYGKSVNVCADKKIRREKITNNNMQSKKRSIKPWNGCEPVVIDGHFDNPKKEWNGTNISNKKGSMKPTPRDKKPQQESWLDRFEELLLRDLILYDDRSLITQLKDFISAERQKAIEEEREKIAKNILDM